MMKAEKTVEVILNIKGEDEAGKLGYYTRKKYVYTDGARIETDENQIIFGMIDDLGWMSHKLCYENYNHGTWQEWLDELRLDRGLDKFYFDAGGNGRPVYIEMDRLMFAMWDLGLIE